MFVIVYVLLFSSCPETCAFAENPPIPVRITTITIARNFVVLNHVKNVMQYFIALLPPEPRRIKLTPIDGSFSNALC